MSLVVLAFCPKNKFSLLHVYVILVYALDYKPCQCTTQMCVIIQESDHTSRKHGSKPQGKKDTLVSNDCGPRPWVCGTLKACCFHV